MIVDAAPRLVSTVMLARYFAAGCAIACRRRGYRQFADMILEERLTAEHITRIFSSSATKTWKRDASTVILTGSVAKYRFSPSNWSCEPERSIALQIVGDDEFARASGDATELVNRHWRLIQSLAVGGPVAAA
jgi:hypothetical protein